MRRRFGAVLFGFIAASPAVFAVLHLGERPMLDDVYHRVFGPADLGPVLFSTLTRRSSPNDALVCPADVCVNTRADIVPPVYPVPAERLRAIVAQAATEESGTRPAWGNSRLGEDRQDRYVARSPIMRFPDTVTVEVFPRGETESTLALYSRSQIGYSDFGVNRARLERWLQRLGEIVRSNA